MKCPNCGHEYKDPRSVKGGRKSRRQLKHADALAMAQKAVDKISAIMRREGVDYRTARDKAKQYKFDGSRLIALGQSVIEEVK